MEFVRLRIISSDKIDKLSQLGQTHCHDSFPSV